MGKSTGQGALELWTYNLKTTEIIANYNSPSHSGPAVKLGPGVIAGDAYKAVSAAGYRIVAPECGLTGIAGGYTQGGGHSQLATAYGMAADQVLEWELVTARGEHPVATPEQNTDLYWALAGGGGGTYGVVLSMAVKAHPDGPVAGGSLVFGNSNKTAFWEAIKTWFHQTPSFVQDTPNNVQFLITNDTLNVFSFVLPDQNASAVDALLSSFLPELEQLNIPLQSHNRRVRHLCPESRRIVWGPALRRPVPQLPRHLQPDHPAVYRAQLNGQRESHGHISLHRRRRHLVRWMLHHQRGRFAGPPWPPAQRGPACLARRHRLLQPQPPLGLGGPLGRHRRQGEACERILSGN